MSDWTLNGAPVLSATLMVPKRGVWVLDAVAVTDDPMDDASVLAVGSVTWAGTVLRGGLAEGRWHGRVLGGAGGLRRTVEARQYRSIPRRLVVDAILSEAGEQLAADASGLDDVLTTWVRLDEPAAHALGRLVPLWRALPDGTITTTPWPDVDAPDLELVEPMPSLNSDLFAVDGLDVLPGMSLNNRGVSCVVFNLDGPAMRACVTYDD